MISSSEQSALDGWIKPETWHTGHPLDDRRFFRFVWAVVKHGNPKPSEGDIEQKIIDQWKGRFADEYLKDKARNYASLYVTLCHFAEERPLGN